MGMILKECVRTEVYISNAGYLVLKQCDCFEEENIISLTPDQADRLYLFIEKNKDEHIRAWEVEP